MTVTTVRPDATASGGGSFTVTGAASAHAATNDNADGTYIRKASSGTASIILGLGTAAIGATQTVRQVRVRARCAGGDASTKANLYLGTRIDGVNYFTNATALRGNAAIGEISGAWYTSAPDGGAWTQEKIDNLRAQWTDYKDSASRAYLYEVYVDVDLAVQPTTTATAPTGTITNTALPDVSWTYSDTESEAQSYFQARVFTVAAASLGGFDPETGSPVWDSGIVASVDTTASVSEYLDDGSYRVYVKTAKTINGQPFWSAWAYSEFTIDVTPPPMPSIAVAYTADEGSVVCTVTGGIPTGFVSQTFEVQRSDDAGLTWATIRDGVVTPAADHTVTVKDYEAPRGTTVLYRVRAIGVSGSDQVASEWGGERPWEVIMRQAVLYIDANVAPGGQTVPNQGSGGTALDATLGSTGGADTNDPRLLTNAAGAYVYLPGVSGNYMSVPDEAALDITGDIDIRVQVAMDDWTPASGMALMAKMGAAGSRSFYCYLETNGSLTCTWYTDGTASLSANSVTAVGAADGTVKWLRYTLDVDNGSGGNDSKWWKSDDGVTWTQVGSTVTKAGTTNIFAGSSAVTIGTYLTPASGLALAGKVYRAILKNGIDGTTALDVDTSVIASGEATSFAALTGQTVSLVRGTSGLKSCAVVSPIWLFGTDDYMTIADNALLDMAAADSFTVVAVTRRWATTALNAVAAKWSTFSGGFAGYLLYHDSANSLRGLIADTGAITYGTAMTETAGTLHVFGMVRDVSNDVVKDFKAGAFAASVTDTTTATLANAMAFTIGRLAGGGQSADMELVAVALFRRAITAGEITVLSDGYQAWANAYPQLAIPNDGAWWMKAVTSPSLNMSGVRVLAGLDLNQAGQVGVFRPIGRSRAVVVEGGLGGWDGTYRVFCSTVQQWETLRSLIAAQATILVQDPFGEQKYIRFTNRSLKLLGTPEAPQRTIDLPYVEVDG